MRFLFWLATVAVIGACATPTKYEAAGKSGDGYRETRIEDNRYRVAFQGNDVTPRETVEHYLLYRAAELTRQNGYKYFVVTERTTEAETEYETVIPVYGYYPFSYRYCSIHSGGLCYRRFPYYAYGYPWGYRASVRADRRYEATAYITMHREMPTGEDEHKIYEAAEVIKNLQPLVDRD